MKGEPLPESSSPISEPLTPALLLSDEERQQRIIINVGGTRFETTRGTLANRPGSWLGKLVLPVPRDEDPFDDRSVVSNVSTMGKRRVE